MRTTPENNYQSLEGSIKIFLSVISFFYAFDLQSNDILPFAPIQQNIMYIYIYIFFFF